MKAQDINLFGIGHTVSVPNLDDYQKIKIVRVSDSGVTVSGPKCGNNVVLSGRTPAILYVEEEQNLEIKQEEKSKESFNKPNQIMTTKNTENSVAPSNEGASIRAKRGSIKTKMAAIQIPDGAFTVKQLADLNSIPASYANAWAKQNAKPAGMAAKQEGKRGRVAALFVVE